jgi:hypothetical protein
VILPLLHIAFDDPCDPFAIRLSSYHCFSGTSVPSVALHVVEFTFARGFDSYRAHHLFNHLPESMSWVRSFFPIYIIRIDITNE